ncbi:BlaI/MecI/CopY family transcriptional regulator, partial [Clostridioides difficile]
MKYDWKKSTTLTFLKNLVDKGFLTTDKVDRCTHYTIHTKQQTDNIKITFILITKFAKKAIGIIADKNRERCFNIIEHM